jgi:hypothetical protein
MQRKFFFFLKQDADMEAGTFDADIQDIPVM